MKHLVLLAAGASTLVVGGLALRALAAGPTASSVGVDSIVEPPAYNVLSQRMKRAEARPTLVEVAAMAAPSSSQTQGATGEDRLPAGTPVGRAPREEAVPPSEVALEAQAEKESAVVATLRSIAAAQQQAQASACLDTDADGGGEYGYFAELAGKAPLRIYHSGGPTIGSASDVVDPTFLPLTFGNIQPGSNGGVASRKGYLFQMWLPEDTVERPIRGIAEAAYGGSANELPGSSNAELMWCCYAWPEAASGAPARVFMINQAGDVVCTDATKKGYLGLRGGPSVDAAYSAAKDMGSQVALGALGLTAQDGNVWNSPAQ